MSAERDRVDVRGVVSYIALAYIPAWLLTAPMWLTGDGLTWTWSPMILIAMAFIPALAALIVTRWISPAHESLLNTGVTSRGGIKVWWRYGTIAWLGPPLVMMVALVVGWMLGVYQADWTGFSGLAEQIQEGVVGARKDPLIGVALTQVVQVFLIGWFNVVPAFGEEFGWRGYLTRALLPLGQPAAFLTTGVLWGLWHIPILALGYNYPTLPVVAAIVMMVCFCTLVGVLLGWLRLASGSVWPPAIAHGFLNASAGLSTVFAAAEHPVDNVSTGLLGWTGWIVLVLLVLLLVLLRKLPVPIASERVGISRGVRRLNRR